MLREVGVEDARGDLDAHGLILGITVSRRAEGALLNQGSWWQLPASGSGPRVGNPPLDRRRQHRRLPEHAAIGGIFGALRFRHREREEQQQQMQRQMAYQQQQGAILAQGKANYERAFKACMVGRGYTVE